MLPISLLKPFDPTPHTRCRPCTRAPFSPTRSTRQRGATRLEFALAVAAAGIVLTLALRQLAQLQSLGDAARDQTVAAQQRSASALAQARCGIEQAPSTSPDLPAPPITRTPTDPCPQPDSIPRKLP